MPYPRLLSCESTRSRLAAPPIATRATVTVSSVLPSSTRTISQSGASPARTVRLFPITVVMLGASLCAGMTRLSEPSSRLRSHHRSMKAVLRKRTVSGLGLIGALVALGALAWLLGVRHAAWLWPGQSDSAAVVLLGQDMSQGNLALSGWLLPVDTYWLTDVPLYAAAVAVRGIVPGLIHDVPLLIYLGVIVSGILIARAGRPGTGGWAGAAVTFVLLGLLGPSAAVTLLHGPAHISTALACLLAFAALRWAGARPPAGYLLAAFLLTIALVSDPMARVVGVAPVLGAAVMTAEIGRASCR